MWRKRYAHAAWCLHQTLMVSILRDQNKLICQSKSYRLLSDLRKFYRTWVRETYFNPIRLPQECITVRCFSYALALTQCLNATLATPFTQVFQPKFVFLICSQLSVNFFPVFSFSSFFLSLHFTFWCSHSSTQTHVLRLDSAFVLLRVRGHRVTS